MTTHSNVTAPLEYQRALVVCRDESERSPKEKQLADELIAARASLKETTSAHEALQSALDARDAELAKAVAERLVALTQLNAVTTQRRTLEVRLEAVEVQLGEALADRRRLLANNHDDLGRRAEAEQRLHVLHAEALANREVVVSALAEHLRRLTPLVTTGRVARELAPQLRELLERVDGLASQVLDDCHLDRQGRADLEMLRAEAVRAVTLAGELMDATLDRDFQRVAID